MVIVDHRKERLSFLKASQVGWLLSADSIRTMDAFSVLYFWLIFGYFLIFYSTQDVTNAGLWYLCQFAGGAKDELNTKLFQVRYFVTCLHFIFLGTLTKILCAKISINSNLYLCGNKISIEGC